MSGWNLFIVGTVGVQMTVVVFETARINIQDMRARD